MAKNKKRRSGIKKKRKTDILTSLKRGFIKLSIYVTSFIGLLFLFDCFYPLTKKQDSEIPEEILNSHPEIPILQKKRKEQIIYHEGFTLSYNSDYRISNWVAYELTADEVKTKAAERASKFIPDPKVKGATAVDSDYRGSGYDRGHLAPAGDMRWSHESMQASFYFSNICPQDRGLNAGVWNDLEKQCRRWATRYGSLLIVTGPVIEDEMERLGKNRVGIPRYFYRVLCDTSGKKPKSIGFLFENRDYKNTSIKSMAIPVDSVEKVSGIDFFPSFPLEVQNEMESTVDLLHWFFWKNAN